MRVPRVLRGNTARSWACAPILQLCLLSVRYRFENVCPKLNNLEAAVSLVHRFMGYISMMWLTKVPELGQYILPAGLLVEA
jgi:hypothetical protein